MDFSLTPIAEPHVSAAAQHSGASDDADGAEFETHLSASDAPQRRSRPRETEQDEPRDDERGRAPSSPAETIAFSLLQPLAAQTLLALRPGAPLASPGQTPIESAGAAPTNWQDLIGQRQAQSPSSATAAPTQFAAKPDAPVAPLQTNVTPTDSSAPRPLSPTPTAVLNAIAAPQDLQIAAPAQPANATIVDQDVAGVDAVLQVAATPQDQAIATTTQASLTQASLNATPTVQGELAKVAKKHSPPSITAAPLPKSDSNVQAATLGATSGTTAPNQPETTTEAKAGVEVNQHAQRDADVVAGNPNAAQANTTRKQQARTGQKLELGVQPTQSTTPAANPIQATSAAQRLLQSVVVEPAIAPDSEISVASSPSTLTATPLTTPTRSTESAAVGGASPTKPPPAHLQLAQQIVRRFDAGGAQFEMRLDPPELGRIEVKLDVSRDRRVIATVSAESAATLTELARGSRDLERILEAAGLELDGQGLSFNLTSGDGDSQQQPGDETAQRSAGFNIGESEHAANTPSPSRPFGLESWRVGRVDIVA
jgi:flagellar hook-length control protein FliK